MKRITAISLTAAALITVGCSNNSDGVLNEEENVTSSTISSADQTPVEGVWFLTREESDFDTIHYSNTDTSKFLTSYILMLNNNGTGAIKKFGAQFPNGVFTEMLENEESTPITYTTNSAYLVINDDAYLCTNNGKELTLESTDSKRYFTAYTDLFPLENWDVDSIFAYGFKPLTRNAFVGNWYSSEWGAVEVTDSGSFASIGSLLDSYQEPVYGTYDVSTGYGYGSSLNLAYYYNGINYSRTYSAPYVSNDGDLVLYRVSGNIRYNTFYNLDRYLTALAGSDDMINEFELDTLYGY